MLPERVAAIAIPHLGRHVGELADRFFRRPSADLRVAGITGTNGKTTSAYLLAQASEFVGRRGWYVGTLGHGHPGDAMQAGLTTPDAVTVQRRLAQARDAGRRDTRPRGFLACARPGPGRGRALRHGRVHQPHARPPRLSRHARGLWRGQGPAVSLGRPALRGDQCARPVRSRPGRASRPGDREDRVHDRERRLGGAGHGLDPRARAAHRPRPGSPSTSSRAGARARCDRAWSASSTPRTCSPCSACCSAGTCRCRKRWPRWRCASHRRAAWKPSVAATDRWCWSITRIRPMRWARSSRPRVRMHAAVCSACSAAAATATRASVR